MTREVPWLYRNPRTGKRVRGEFPNLSMIAFLSSHAASVFVPDDDAADELIRGHSPFRRIMGAGVLLIVGGLAAVPSRSTPG